MPFDSATPSRRDQVIDNLRAARHLLKDFGIWCTHSRHNQEEGSHVVQHCMIGALDAVMYGPWKRQVGDCHDEVQVLASAITGRYPGLKQKEPSFTIMLFNDTTSHDASGHQSILQMFDRAITMAEWYDFEREVV